MQWRLILGKAMSIATTHCSLRVDEHVGLGATTQDGFRDTTASQPRDDVTRFFYVTQDVHRFDSELKPMAPHEDMLHYAMRDRRDGWRDGWRDGRRD